MSKKNTLEKWLPHMRPRAVIYDFDNTLFHSPSREEGSPLYEQHTGRPWPHRGWWGRVETLMPPIVPALITEDCFIRSTLDAYRLDRLCENTNVYLMTGRPEKMASRIREILEAVKCSFDGYFYRGMAGTPRGIEANDDTLVVKNYLIRSHVIHPRLETLELWEDRPEHMVRFCAEARRWKDAFAKHLGKVIVHDVLTGESHEF